MAKKRRRVLRRARRVRRRRRKNWFDFVLTDPNGSIRWNNETWNNNEWTLTHWKKYNILHLGTSILMAPKDGAAEVATICWDSPMDAKESSHPMRGRFQPTATKLPVCFMISEWRSDRQDTGVMSSGNRVLTIMYWSLDTLVTGTGPGNDVLSIYTWTGSNCVFAMPTFLYCTLQSLAQLCAVGIWEIVGIYLFVRDKNKHCVWMEFRCNCSFLWWLVVASWTYHGNTMEMW